MAETLKLLRDGVKGLWTLGILVIYWGFWLMVLTAPLWLFLFVKKPTMIVRIMLVVVVFFHFAESGPHIIGLLKNNPLGGVIRDKYITGAFTIFIGLAHGGMAVYTANRQWWVKAPAWALWIITTLLVAGFIFRKVDPILRRAKVK